MSLAGCIPELVAQGKIRKSDAEKADRAYKRHYEALKDGMGEEAAAAEATTRTLKELDYAAKLRKRQAALMIIKQRRLDVAHDAAVAKGMEPHRFAVETLRRVEIARERLENQAHESMLAFIQRHRRNLLGRAKDKTGLFDVVDELHGKDTGNANAQALARGVADTFERERLRFNRAGGDIGTRADFGLPHRWDPLKVRKVSLDEFRADVLGELLPEKMVDPLSGGAFTPERLDEFIEAAYRNIRTNGLTEIGGAGGLASRALANRRSDPRFFVFKDGRAWLRISSKYGDGNAFEAIMSHVHGMSRDIAFMEALGPNPAATWRRLIDRSDRIAANSDMIHTGAISGSSPARYHADQMWRYMNGDLTVPVVAEGDGLIARGKRGALSVVHGTRDLLASALLGSAQLTSIVDVNTNLFTRKFNALPQMNVLLGYLKQLNPLDAGDRRFAIYLGAGVRDATRTMAGLARWFGETSSPRWTQVLSDDVLRVTGMNKFFEAGRGSFIKDHFAQLAMERHLDYPDLPEARRAEFERHGITPEDWQAMRQADVTSYRGQDYMDWHRIAAASPEAADKLVDAILREARSAVIESDAESQSFVRFGRPGTLKGEIGGNTFQFKSFPVALLMDQARRVAEINARAGGGARGLAAAGKYLASFLVGMWALGAVSLQAKELVKGRDLRPMDNWDFWFDSFVNGGGLGPIGDLVGSLKQDVVNGLGEYIGGPFVSLVEDSANTASSAFKTDAQTGERGREFGHQVTRFLRRYTPGTTIWYLRAALDRLVWDEIEDRIDPDHAEHQRKMQTSVERRGQGYYYAPGDTMPHRAPTIGETPPH